MINPITFSTLELTLTMAKYRFIGEMGSDPIKIRIQKPEKISFTKAELFSLLLALPASAKKMISPASETLPPYALPDFLDNKQKFYDAVMVLIDHINDRAWLDKHASRVDNLNVARYTYTGYYADCMAEFDVEIKYDFQMNFVSADKTVYHGYEHYQGPLPITIHNSEEMMKSLEEEFPEIAAELDRKEREQNACH